jgi:uncharacterized protein with HEPN domain
MTDESEPVLRMREAVDTVTRFTTRGCSGTACDLARGAFMGNQLAAIGKAAMAVPSEVRAAYVNIPWDSLMALADERGGVASMTADEMQRFVERDLRGVKQALARANKKHR